MIEGLLCPGSSNVEKCENPIKFIPADVTKHPDFVGPSLDMTPEDRANDIAIITPRQAIILGPTITAVGVVPANYKFSNKKPYRAYGFGTSVLMEYNFDSFIKGHKCASFYQILADQLKSKKLVCFGVRKDLSILDLFCGSNGKKFKENCVPGDSGGGIYAVGENLMAGMIQGRSKGLPDFFIPLAQHHTFITT